jgi:hypothetical protein
MENGSLDFWVAYWNSFFFLAFVFFPSEPSVMLMLYNFLFASLIFPLNGALTKKVFILAIGNIVGICWNYLFYLFAYAAANSPLGYLFSIPYIILSPFLNLVWVVSFWAVSLTLLAPSKERLRVNFDS